MSAARDILYHILESNLSYIHLVSSVNSCSLNDELKLASRDRMAHNKIIKCDNLEHFFRNYNLLCGRCINVTCETWQEQK